MVIGRPIDRLPPSNARTCIGQVYRAHRVLLSAGTGRGEEGGADASRSRSWSAPRPHGAAWSPWPVDPETDRGAAAPSAAAVGSDGPCRAGPVSEARSPARRQLAVRPAGGFDPDRLTGEPEPDRTGARKGRGGAGWHAQDATLFGHAGAPRTVRVFALPAQDPNSHGSIGLLRACVPGGAGRALTARYGGCPRVTACDEGRHWWRLERQPWPGASG